MNSYIIILIAVLVLLILVLTVTLCKIGLHLQNVIKNRNSCQKLIEEYSHLLDIRITEVARLKEQIYNLKKKDE